MKIYVQNMVSLRCKLMVILEMNKLEIPYRTIELGEIQLMEHISPEKLLALREALHISGLEIMDDKKTVLIERIKNVIIEMVHYADELPETNFSDYLSKTLNQDYHQMSEIFSKTKGITIEHFIIIHKIERVKELIIYDDMNLTEIAWKMNYSSVAHLSNQFKKVTGMTPSAFKALTIRKRTNLENL